MRWDEGTIAISNYCRWSVHSRNELRVLLSSTYCTACAVTIPMGSEVIDSVSSFVISSLLSVTLIHEQLILHVAKRITLIAVDSFNSLECMLHSYCYTRVIYPASWENAMQFILECLKKDASCCDCCDIRAMDHCCAWLLCRYSIDVVIVHHFIFNSMPCCLCDVLMKGILLLKRFWLCCVGDVFPSIQSPSPKWQRVWMEYAAWWSEEGCCGDADGLLS